ncbi:MAG: branched-chain amino acid ABC transporter permease [Methanobacteriota archaeon]
MALAEVAQLAVNGLVVGGILALAGVGLSLVYGILNLSNFAHGDFMTLGAYLVFFLSVEATGALPAEVAAGLAAAIGFSALALVMFRKVSRREALGLSGVSAVLLVVGVFGGPIVRATVLAAVLVAIFAMALDLALWRPLRRRRATLVSLVIVSIGVALVVRHAVQLVWGSDFRNYDLPLRPAERFLGLSFTYAQIVALLTAIAAAILLEILLRRTRTGKAMRALADDVELARVCGIDTDRVILYVWALAGVLVTLAGVLLGLVTNLHPNLGWSLLLPTFAAVILGGIGSARGAVLGGLTIGLAMELSALSERLLSYKQAIAFGILILVLLVRPQGILGGKGR